MAVAKNQAAANVVATGIGEAAKRIISLAKEHGIAIKEDEDLVELLSRLDLGEEIPPNMYKAVQEIFAFIYKLSSTSAAKG